MTKRMQVLFEDDEFIEIRRVALRHRMTVAEWVRQALRQARRVEPVIDPRRQIAAVREASRGVYRTADVGHMLDEIEGGYLDARFVRAGDVAKAWSVMPRLTAAEATEFSKDLSRARKALAPPKSAWE